MKRTVEINDTLPEILDAAKDDLKDLLLQWLEENGYEADDDVPCLNNDLDYSGGFSEICDSATPIYTHEIKDLFYLYGDDFEEAFDNAGFEREADWPNGWQAAAIYCYIEQELAVWYEDNAAGICVDYIQGKEK